MYVGIIIQSPDDRSRDDRCMTVFLVLTRSRRVHNLMPLNRTALFFFFLFFRHYLINKVLPPFSLISPPTILSNVCIMDWLFQPKLPGRTRLSNKKRSAQNAYICTTHYSLLFLGLQERTDWKLHKIVIVTVSQHSFSFFHIFQIVDRSKVNPAMTKVVMPGVGALFEVEADVAAPMIEVTVLVLARIVVPGMTLPSLVVPGTSVTPSTTLGLCVRAGTVLGTTVVPRITVV